MEITLNTDKWHLAAVACSSKEDDGCTTLAMQKDMYIHVYVLTLSATWHGTMSPSEEQKRIMRSSSSSLVSILGINLMTNRRPQVVWFTSLFLFELCPEVLTRVSSTTGLIIPSALLVMHYFTIPRGGAPSNSNDSALVCSGSQNTQRHP